jgi:hypothetical protein
VRGLVEKCAALFAIRQAAELGVGELEHHGVVAPLLVEGAQLAERGGVIGAELSGFLEGLCRSVGVAQAVLQQDPELHEQAGALLGLLGQGRGTARVELCQGAPGLAAVQRCLVTLEGGLVVKAILVPRLLAHAHLICSAVRALGRLCAHRPPWLGA